MELGNILEFRRDLYFEGAVQADWFYSKEKAAKVAENFVFHGKKYFGTEEQETGSKKRIDTISLVEELLEKMSDDHTNALTLAIADYGTGKSHLAVTLGQLFSGKYYMPETYNKILSNISSIDFDAAEHIRSMTDERNFVLVINGMRDFNLHSEILKAAQKSLRLYGLPDDGLKKINRALETAEVFFRRNSTNSIALFEEKAKSFGWNEIGDTLIKKIEDNLMTDETAFDIVNSVYMEINGQEIRWDEGLSASNILEMLISEYCGMNGKFEHIILLFDEFGRYLEYASGVNAAKSGDSALQQIFEVAQNAEGVLQVINFIQSDIKTYLQRVDQTKNISRYIGRYDASDKYYISSNLETVFANLIQRKDKIAFEENVVAWQKNNEDVWKDIFEKLNRWIVTKGMWKDYSLFRKVVVEGIYPMHPISTFMLTQLSDYLQNRSSLTLISQYIENSKNVDIANHSFLIMPETLMTGDLYTEMLAAEQEGKQPSQQCIRYDNIIRKYQDKLSEKSLAVLRSNLILRILRFRTKDYNDAKEALSLCCGFSMSEIEEELKWLENEYAVLGFDDHAGCFDFMEDSTGAHDFKLFKKRLLAGASIDKSILQSVKIKEIAGVLEKQTTNFALQHKITTNEWLFEQELYAIEEFDQSKVRTYLESWKTAISSTTAKGRLVWLYVNKDTEASYLERAKELVRQFSNTPIIVMLLNDLDNRLYESLLEYDVLDRLDDINRNKYDRYYQADYEQAENNLKDEFSELKKQRIQLGADGIEEIKARIPMFLTSVFDSIYPSAISFTFDGFITKGNNIGGKGGAYYCSIVKMLLSNTVNETTIHNFASDVRNRIEALLMTSNATSWKCIDKDYRVIPPEDTKVRKVYDDILEKISKNQEFACINIFKEYCRPPYGMSEDVVVLMIAVICANMNYCLRFKYNDSLININSWKELVVIKDKKIDINVVKKSAFVMVDAGAVTDKYVRFFKRIQSNKNISEISLLERILLDMKEVDEIPEALETQYLLSMKYLNSGKRANNEWRTCINEINKCLDLAIEKKDLYDALKGLQLVKDIPYSKIFKDNGYEVDAESRATVKELEIKLTDEVDQQIETYVGNMRCKTIEGVNTFRNHNNKLQTMLIDVGFDDYASQINKRKEAILGNVNEIRSYQELRVDCKKYLEGSQITKYETYVNFCRYLKTGEELQGRIEKHADMFGKDLQKIQNDISDRVEILRKNCDRIKQDMSDIWDDLYEVKNIEDVEILINNITTVLQKGISDVDQKDFEDLRENLQELLNDINDIKGLDSSRNEFNVKAESMIKKYETSDYEFDVLDILKTIISNVENELDKKEHYWINNSLTLEDKSRGAVHRWKEKIKYLPKYLSQETIEKVKLLDSEADKIISEGKIEDVIFYFDRLDNDEKLECIQKLEKMISDSK